MMSTEKRKREQEKHYTVPAVAFRGRLTDAVAGSAGINSLTCVSIICDSTGARSRVGGRSGGAVVDDEEATWLTSVGRGNKLIRDQYNMK